MSQSLSKLIFETQRLLSAKIGAEYPFYKKTACLDDEIRELIAYCEIVKIFINNERLRKLIDEKLVPALEKIGIARWKRTEITDLGLKIGYESSTVSLKYLERAKEEAEDASD
jgi:predicted RNA-binding protein